MIPIFSYVFIKTVFINFIKGPDSKVVAG